MDSSFLLTGAAASLKMPINSPNDACWIWRKNTKTGWAFPRAHRALSGYPLVFWKPGCRIPEPDPRRQRPNLKLAEMP